MECFCILFFSDVGPSVPLIPGSGELVEADHLIRCVCVCVFDCLSVCPSVFLSVCVFMLYVLLMESSSSYFFPAKGSNMFRLSHPTVMFLFER